MAQISRRLRFEVLRRDGYACRYCGAQAPDVQLEIDHVVPDILGGSSEPANLVTACVPCNRGKSSIQPDAPVVEDVARDALRWSRAVEEAAKLRRLERAQMADQVDAWVTHWKGIMPEVTVDKTWATTIERFLSLGLSVEDLQELATELSCKVGSGPYSVRRHTAWRYYCGMAWRTISAIQEDARRMVEEGEGEVACG